MNSKNKAVRKAVWDMEIYHMKRSLRQKKESSINLITGRTFKNAYKHISKSTRINKMQRRFIEDLSRLYPNDPYDQIDFTRRHCIRYFPEGCFGFSNCSSYVRSFIGYIKDNHKDLKTFEALSEKYGKDFLELLDFDLISYFNEIFEESKKKEIYYLFGDIERNNIGGLISYFVSTVRLMKNSNKTNVSNLFYRWSIKRSMEMINQMDELGLKFKHKAKDRIIELSKGELSDFEFIYSKGEKIKDYRNFSVFASIPKKSVKMESEGKTKTIKVDSILKAVDDFIDATRIYIKSQRKLYADYKEFKFESNLN